MESMVQVRDSVVIPPWDGLGFVISPETPIDHFLRLKPFRWLISKEPNFGEVRSGGDVSYVEVPDSFRLVRQWDQRTLCPYVGKDYKPMQNREIIAMFQESLGDANLSIDTIGTLRDGTTIWALVDVHESFTLKGGDEVRGYILFHYAHEYGRKFRMLFTPIRTASMNVLIVASSRIDKIEQPVSSLLSTLRGQAELLSSTPFSEARGVEYIVRLVDKVLADKADTGTIELPTTIAQALEKPASQEEHKIENRRHLSRTAREILEAMDTMPGADLESARGTAWGYYNAIVYAQDHLLGRNQDTRLESAWFGAGSKLKVRALNLALEMAKTS